uniref:Carbohydrate sulfotransferase n=1 Tax=Oryzias latipes TaxID=8090 RepID=A0A3P9J433_ORYLA
QHITAGCKMLAGKAYMERHNQVAGIIYRNMCAEYELETPRSKWETPPKVVENERAKILWDFQIQADRMVMANQPDIVVVDKEQRKAVMAKLKHYTKFLFVRDPFVRLISAYRDKMLNYDQYFYEGYIRVILQRYKNQKGVPVKYNGTKKTDLKPSFHNFVQYIVDPRSEKYAPFEPHWRQMHRLCHPCLVEYDFVGHQESLQEDAQQLLNILKLENAIKFPPSHENMTSGNSVMEWFQGVPIEDRRKLYKIYEKDFQLFGYRRPTELLDD